MCLSLCVYAKRGATKWDEPDKKRENDEGWVDFIVTNIPHQHHPFLYLSFISPHFREIVQAKREWGVCVCVFCLALVYDY